MTDSQPPIGVPRVYDGAEIPVLYPGERATAQLDVEAILAQFDSGALVVKSAIPVVGWLRRA